MEKGLIRQVVFGAEDGLVSILGLVTGVALSNPQAAFLAGFVGAFAGAVSMAAGEYLGSKSQIDAVKEVLKEEGEVSKRHKEHDLKIVGESLGSPLLNTFAMFISYVAASFFPVGPYALFNAGFLGFFSTLYISIIGTFLVVFIIGAAKTRFTGRNWFKSGVEMLVVALIAAVVGYAAGLLIG